MKHETRDLHSSTPATASPPAPHGSLLACNIAPRSGARFAFVLASLLCAGAALAAPGVELYHEDFENGLADGQIVLLPGYTGAGGETYESEPNWNNPASCNGFVLDGTTNDADIGALGCAGSSIANQLRNLATALGTFNGSGPAGSNHAVAAFTANPPSPADAVEFRTAAPIGISVTNRFLTFSVNVTAINCDVGRPALDFFLDDGGTEIPVSNSPINPCPGATSGTGTFSSDGSILFTGSTLGIVMRNVNGGTNGNDHAFDDIRVIDATPQLTKAFAPGPWAVGDSVPLTFTVTNTDELAEKTGWAFTDTLPPGLELAADGGVSTCAAADIVAVTGGDTVAIANGSIASGVASCTITVQVTSATAGTYRNGPSNLAPLVGLDPPVATEVTFGVPPFATCDSRAFLFQGSPTDVIAIDLATGHPDLLGNDIYPNNINAVGYNTQDNYIYGLAGTGSGFLARIGSNMSVETLARPTGLPSGTFLIGDFDSDGNYWVRGSGGGVFGIDLVPGSATYNQVIASLTTNTPGGFAAGNDWAFNPVDGLFYQVPRSTSTQLLHLWVFDPGSAVTTDLGPIAGLAGFTGASVGAAYADAEGFIYAADNNTGNIFRIDPTTVTGALSAHSDPSSTNDGARCSAATLSLDFGDAPEIYGTTLASDGPRHSIAGYDAVAHTALLMLGATIDADADGQPGPAADGDDSADVDDEDAVSAMPAAVTTQTSYSVTLAVHNGTGQPAEVTGWVDWNRNDAFDPGEGVTEPVADGATSATLTWNGLALAGVAPGTLHARLRIAPAGEIGANNPAGVASAGEVEDHPVTLTGAPVLPPDYFLTCPVTTTPPVGAFSISEMWRSTGIGVPVYQTPLVGDIYGTGQPVVVIGSNTDFAAGASTAGRVARDINIYRGSDGVLLDTIATPLYLWTGNAALALADVDGDGQGEVLLKVARHPGNDPADDGRLIAYRNDGTMLWMSDQRYDYDTARGGLGINVADFNADGVPEVFVGNQIFNAQTGARLVALTAADPSGCQHSACLWGNTTAADLDGDGLLELIAGSTAYTVNLFNLNGEAGNSLTVLAEADPLVPEVGDGWSAIADIDLDGAPEVVVVRPVDGTQNGPTAVLVWDPATGAVEGLATGFGNGGSQPFVGDIDGDGAPEIVLTTANELHAFEYVAGTGLALKWTLPTSDSSAVTTLSMFDFNSDGVSELVYRDTTQIRIINGNGATAVDLATFACVSGTGTEMPVIADLDGSGEARIITACGDGDDREGNVRVYATASFPWAQTRSVWNQENYFVTHVNDDLSIPAPQFPNWTSFADPAMDCGSGTNRPLNAFQQQVTNLDPNTGCPVVCAPPDISIVKVLTAEDGSVAGTAEPGEQLTWTITLTNAGGLAAVNYAVTDTLDPNVSFVSADNGGVLNGGNVEWTGLTIAPLGSLTLTVVAEVVDPIPLGVTEIGNVAYETGTTPPDCTASPLPANCAETPTEPFASVTIAKALAGESGATPGIAEPGEQLTYTITLANAGGADALNYGVTDPLDANVAFVSADNGGTEAGGVVTWSGLTVPAGGNLVLTVLVQVAAPIPPGVVEIGNLAHETGDTPPDCSVSPLPANCTETPTAPNVAIAKAVADASGNGEAEPGETLTYTITLINSGGSDATNYGVTDPLDPNVAFVSADNGGTEAGGIVTWSGLAVPAGGSVALTVVVTVVDPIPAGVTEIGNVAYEIGGVVPDCSAVPQPAGCADIPSAANVTIAKTVADASGNGEAEAGETLTYTITLTNSGGSDALNYGVTDPLDPNVVFVAADNGGVHAAGVVTWSGLTVPANGNLVLTVVVTVVDPIPDGVTEIANVAHETGTPPPACPPAGGACAIVPTAPDVTIAKALAAESGSAPGIAEPGETLSYTITLANTGGSAAAGYAVTDALDPNVSFLGADNGGTLVGTNVEWSGLTVPAGGGLVLNVDVLVNDPLPLGVTEVGNVAYETGTTPPDCSVSPVPANCVDVPVVHQPFQACTAAEVRATERWWYYGERGVIDFGVTGTTATALVNPQAIIADEGSTVVTDTSGNLLFWSNGQVIYDRNQDPMPNGSGLLGNSSATQTVAAFPAVGNPGVYFVVTTDTDIGTAPNGQLRYSVVDMSLNGGLGDVVIGQKNIDLGAPATASEALTAVPNADGTGFWVLTYTNNAPELLAYAFDDIGPVGVTVSTLSTNNGNGYGSLYFNAQLNLVAQATGENSGAGQLRVLDFDAASGVAYERFAWPAATSAGGSNLYTADFSPAGDYLYLTRIYGTGALYRYRIEGATTVGEVVASEEYIGPTGGDGGHVRRGADGRMYVVGTFGYDRLSVVNAPDDPLDPDYQLASFDLPAGHETTYGLPQMVTGCSVPTAADVTIVKALTGESGAIAGEAEAGEQLTYTITLTNSGGADATPYAVTDVLDPNVTFVSADNGGVLNGSDVEWSGLSVPGYGSLVLTVVVEVADPIPSGVTEIGNVAYETGGSVPDCSAVPQPANCVDVPTEADVAIAKTVADASGNGEAEPGEQLTYTITLANSGGSDALNYAVTDPLDPNVTFVSADNGGILAAGIVTWSGLTVPAGGNLVLTVVVTVNDPIPDGVTEIGNVAFETGTPEPDCDVVPQPAGCVDIPSTADVAIGKSVADASGNGEAEPGETLTYTITLTNTGGSDATNYGVTDPLDPNVVFVSADNGGAAAGGVVTWTGLTVPASGNLVLTVVVTVADPIPDGVTEIGNVAFETGTPEPDCSVVPQPANCADIPSTADVAIAKTVADASGNGIAEPGEVLTYTITLTNTGGSDALNYGVTDPLDPNVAFVSADNGGTETAGIVTWNGLTVPAGGNLVLTVVVQVAAPIPPGVLEVGNLAHETGTPEPDCSVTPQPANCVDIPSAANVTIAKTVADASGNGEAEPGEQLTYSIILTNSGGSNALNYGVTDPLDPNVGFVSADNGGVHAGGVVTWSGLIVPANGNLVLTVVVTVDDPIPAGVLEIGNLAHETGTPEPDCSLVPQPANCVDIPSAANVTIAKTVADASGNGEAEPGETLTYTITLTNSGGSDATGYGVTDPLDPNVVFASADNGGTEAGGVVTWSGLTVPASSNLVLTVVVTVVDPIPDGVTEIGNVAYETGTPEPDCDAVPQPAGCVDIPSTADVTIVKTVVDASGNGQAEPGETLTYTITLSNDGGSDATNYGVTDPLDANVVFVSADNGGTEAGGVVTWSGLTVPASGNLVLTVVVAVVDPIPDGVTTIGNVAFETGTPEPDCDAVPQPAGCVDIPSTADVTIAKTVMDASGNGQAEPGETLTYSITLSNDGGSDATNYGVTDPLDPNVVFVSADNGGSEAGGVVTWSGLTVPASGNLVLTVVVAVVDPIPDGVTEIGNVAFETGMPEPDCDVTPQPAGCVDLPTGASVSVSKALTGESIDPDGIAQPGEELTYTLTVWNQGGTAATDVLVNEWVPANTSFVGGTPTWTCAPGAPGGTACDSIVDVPAFAGGSPGMATLTFIVAVDDPLADGVTNVANAVALDDGTPPDCAALPTQPQCVVVPTVNLSLVKSVVSVEPTGPNTSRVLYRMVVTNTGGSDSQYTLTDTLGFTPDGVVFNGEAQVTTLDGTINPALPGGVFTPANGVTVQLSDSLVTLPAGSSHTYELLVPFAIVDNVQNGDCAGGAGNGLYNQAALSGSLDVEGGACAPVSGDQVHIALVKTVGLDTDQNGNGLGDAGDVLRYDFEVSNTGAVPLSPVQLFDPRVAALQCQMQTANGRNLRVLHVDVDLLFASGFEAFDLGSLDPGDVVDCWATYVLTQADVDRRRVTNTATTAGAGPNGQIASATSTAIFTAFP